MNDQLKILIVDDEPLSRKRITSFPLQGCGFKIVGEAENGKDALEKIEKLEPDIVVTDIVMPVMDGLQLLEKIQCKPNPPKVVMLTCYDDFEKVQAALRLGASDYIIKTMLQEEDFIKSINRVSADISKERRLIFRNLRSTVEKLMRANSERFARQYLNQLDELDFSLPVFRLVMLTMSEKFMEVTQANKFSVEKWDGSLRCMVPELSEKQICMLLYSPESIPMAEFEKMSDDFCRVLFKSLVNPNNLEKSVFHIIIGRSMSGALCLPNAYESILSCKSRLFYSNISSGILYENKMGIPLENFPAEEFQSCLNHLREYIQNLDGENALECLVSWLSEVETKYRPLPDEVRSMAQSLASVIPQEYVYIEADGTEWPLTQWIKEKAIESESIFDMEEIVCEARNVLCSNLNVNGTVIRYEVKKAIEFIHRNYGSNISLQSAASHVKLSESWFGALFKSEVNQSFSDYLRNYRISKAKKLLRRTDMTINQISECVGIADPHYFSRIFTKVAGINPKEYRNKAVIGESQKIRYGSDQRII